ncbi:DegV family protein [Paenibacillus validus]|uniref:DegV family EDD domain-containing protein n=1 Tax=Paenibacillus validus TaxID=44253 RepID=A0A7X2ZG81_9BACL|nr:MULTISPECIES: DegV family protein [Paenibacillus]MED4602904.1 DegV family protein [Paenibacillus validus]MED4609486.1 DegV family protein [Paenibacillus validus]MUG73688.1 DegV family EDD domain-containing protein [Paenibacillus validus]
MSQVRIVTDSTADIPKDVREKLGIEMVPLKVLFGTESYRDAVDISADAFYDKLTGSNVMPTTSQPSPIEFLEVYQQLAEQGDGPIISIHLSSAMSGTYQSALIAKTMIDDKIDIDVVDSKSASYGFGLLVVAAAEAARQGKSREEILAMIAGIRESTKIYFLVDTLEFLQKGGRIGKAAALVGSLLNIKPILSISDDGQVFSVDKVRGTKKAMGRIAEMLKQDFGHRPLHLIFAYTKGQEHAQELQRQLESQFQVQSINYTQIGSVIGAHAGPGTIAVFAYPAQE